MPAAEKLLLAVSIGRGAIGRWRLQRILTVLVTVAILIVATAVMMGILAIGGLYAAYLFLLSQGLDSGMALLMTGVLVLLIASVAVITLKRHLRELKVSMRTPVGETVNAFLDGLFSQP
jgi:hypothetical protein